MSQTETPQSISLNHLSVELTVSLRNVALYFRLPMHYRRMRERHTPLSRLCLNGEFFVTETCALWLDAPRRERDPKECSRPRAKEQTRSSRAQNPGPDGGNFYERHLEWASSLARLTGVCCESATGGQARKEIGCHSSVAGFLR
jgi:hypothetical protein